MKPFTNCLAFGLSLCFLVPALGQEFSGTWQADGKPRRVLKISRTVHGYLGDFFDLGSNAIPKPHYDSVSAIVVSGKTVHFSLDKMEGTFDGTLSNDGKTIAGSWRTLYGLPSQPLTFSLAAKKDQWVIDASPHKVRFVTVQPGVKLEVLDWGGNGPPLIFLSGLGDTGHAFDGFAEKFTGKHHVYAITRRGFGASGSAPLTNTSYDADRLGDDVLAVMDTLGIEKSVLAGHSIAGEELSSIGTRHPDKVAGLIYLDAVNQFSIYDPMLADLSVETATVKRDLGMMFNPQYDQRSLIAEVQSALPNLEKALSDAAEADATASRPPMTELVQKPEDLAGDLVFDNTRRYGPVKSPVLAIVAEPRQCGNNCDKPFMQKIMAAAAARDAYLEKESPDVHLVRIPKASHYIWHSNEAQVEQEMNAFMDGLKP